MIVSSIRKRLTSLSIVAAAIFLDNACKEIIRAGMEHEMIFFSVMCDGWWGKTWQKLIFHTNMPIAFQSARASHDKSTFNALFP